MLNLLLSACSIIFIPVTVVFMYWFVQFAFFFIEAIELAYK